MHTLCQLQKGRRESMPQLVPIQLSLAHMSKRRQRPSQKGSDRGEYLSQLVQEYLVTRSLGKYCLPWQRVHGLNCSSEAKQQVLANLANFAYDPINYEHLWQANAIDLFISMVYLYWCASDI